MSYRGYRYSEDSDWGDIFGLKPTDLTEEQLEKIKFGKLLELAPEDPRAERIAGDRLSKCTTDEIKKISKLKSDELANLNYLISKYNECIATKSDNLEQGNQGYRKQRGDFVFWDLLNKANKAREFIRWLGDKSSIVNTSKIDYKWLYERHTWIADQTVERVIKICKGYEGRDSLPRMLRSLPETPTLKFVDIIYKELSGTDNIHLLSNPYTPVKYKKLLCRDIAGRKKVPRLDVVLNKDIVSSLPPVMRLKLLETLLIHMRGGSVILEDINSEEDLRPLLFGTAIKYNDRVEKVMRHFRHLCEKSGD